MSVEVPLPSPGAVVVVVSNGACIPVTTKQLSRLCPRLVSYLLTRLVTEAP